MIQKPLNWNSKYKLVRWNGERNPMCGDLGYIVEWNISLTFITVSTPNTINEGTGS